MCMYVVSQASHPKEKVSLLTLSSEAGSSTKKVDETTLQHKMAVCYTATTHAEV